MTGRRPSADAVEAWRSLLGYVRRSLAELDRDLWAERGIGLDDYDVLFQLSRGSRSGMRMSALAGELVVAASSCTRHVGQLVDQGWVERRPDPDDGRAVVVALTATGRGVLAKASVGHLRGIDRIFAAPLGEEGLERCRAVLEALNVRLDSRPVV